MSPELTRGLRRLGLSSREFAAITGVHEDIVSSWSRKRHPVLGVRPEPLWAQHLVRAWLKDPSLLVDALIAARARAGSVKNGAPSD